MFTNAFSELATLGGCSVKIGGMDPVSEQVREGPRTPSPARGLKGRPCTTPPTLESKPDHREVSPSPLGRRFPKRSHAEGILPQPTAFHFAGPSSPANLSPCPSQASCLQSWLVGRAHHSTQGGVLQTPALANTVATSHIWPLSFET